jgi:3-oxoacyl-[acyl-carrier protein] reductase
MSDYARLSACRKGVIWPHAPPITGGPKGETTMTTPSHKVAIVTGGGGGIGAAICERLARDGFTVVINYAGNAAAAEALAASIETAGGRAITAQADIADSRQAARLFSSAETAFGGVDVLVNNAGVMRLATIADSDDELFDRQIAVNLKGTFNTLREASRRLREGGRIVNLSSSVVGLLQPTYGVYAATKAAVEAMTSILAKEMRGRNITVNAIAPGPTATKLFLNGKPQEVVDHLSKLAPLERLGQPKDIADAVAFLAGPDSAWINGQTLRANGGII